MRCAAAAFILAAVAMPAGLSAPAVAQAGAPVEVGGAALPDAASLRRQLTPITGETRPATVELRLPFASGSAALTEAARARLDVLAGVLTEGALATARFGVHGHTDAAGSRDYNLKLSRERADSVARHLAARGVDSPRLEVAGFGPDRLARPEAPRDAANRRVEIVNLSPPAPVPDAAPGGAQPAGRGGGFPITQ